MATLKLALALLACWSFAGSAQCNPAELAESLQKLNKYLTEAAPAQPDTPEADYALLASGRTSGELAPAMGVLRALAAASPDDCTDELVELGAATSTLDVETGSSRLERLVRHLVHANLDDDCQYLFYLESRFDLGMRATGQGHYSV